MALEDLTGTKYIDDLNSSNPAAGDNVSEGDDHIRGIKNVLKVTFPSIDGAITATDTELNYVDGVTSAVQTQLDAKLPLAGGAMTGAITTNSTFDGVDVAACNTTANAALPKAGGTMTGNIVSGDNVKATYGASADLEIYHDGADSIIKDKGTGNLSLRTNGNFYVVNEASSEVLIRADVNGSVDLYYDNSKKFETTSTGVTTTGTTTSGVYYSSVSSGQALSFGDNAQIHLGTGDDLQIYHDGSNSYIADTATGDLIIKGTQLKLRSAGNEDYVVCTADGSVELRHNDAKKFETYASGVQATGNCLSTTGLFGIDTNDNITVGTSDINFLINGNQEMRLESDGDLHVDGDVIAYSTTISDERLKDNIEVVDGALDKVKQLRGVTFNRKQDGQESAGVIAQDVEKVLPQAVKEKALPLQTGNDGLFKTVQYDALHALLIESIKELSARIEVLESK